MRGLFALKGLSTWHAAALCGAVGAAVFASSLHGVPVYDDIEVIVKNPDMAADAPLSALWRHDFWGAPLTAARSHKSYRPLTSLSFKLDLALAGQRGGGGGGGGGSGGEAATPPSPHALVVLHATNIALHALASALVALLGAALLRPSMRANAEARAAALTAAAAAAATGVGGAEAETEGGSSGGGGYDDAAAATVGLLAGLLFAVHPVHVEAVAGLVGRADELATCAVLCSCLLFLRGASSSSSSSSSSGGGGGFRYRWLCASLLCAAAAMLCKETGAVAPAIVGALDVLLLCDADLTLGTAVALLTGGLQQPPPAADDADAKGRRPIAGAGAGAAAAPALRRGLLLRLLLLAAGAAACLCGRLWVMGGVGNRPTFRDFENPAAHVTTAPLTRWLSIAHYNVLSALLLVAPAVPTAGTALCVDWSYGAVRLVTSLKDRRNGGTLLLLALLAALCRGTGVLLPSAAHGASKEADDQDDDGEAEEEEEEEEQAAKKKKKKKNDDANAPVAAVVTTLAAGEVVVAAQLEAQEDRLWWRALGVCLFGTLLSVLPGANVLFTVGFTVAERVLYVRSLATDYSGAFLFF